MLKSLRRLLRNFPANSSNLKISEIKKEVNQLATEIKKQKTIQTEVQIFDSKLEKTEDNSSENILGDLLFYLRTQKFMSTLMVCRQIEKIEIESDVAKLFSETADLTEIVTNEKHKQVLDEYFKNRGLSFKIKEKNKEVDPIEKLREYFGEKLIVR